MTSNVALIVENYADEATLSTTTGMETALPLEYLQRGGRSLVARTTGVTDWVIKGAWSAVKAVRAFALARNNLSGGSTVRFRVWSGAAWDGNLVYDSGTLNGARTIEWGQLRWGVDPWGGVYAADLPRHFVRVLDQAVAGQSFQIDISNATNPDGYLEVGRLFIGPVLQPAYNADYDNVLTPVDTSEHTRMADGTLATDEGVQYRRFEFALSWLSDTERGRFFTALRRAGRRQEVLVCLYPGDSDAQSARFYDFTLIAKITNDPPFAHSHYNNHGLSFVFEET